MRSDSIPVDVAIVGAGLAGLATARQLFERQRSVVVLEARERLGGRLESQRFPGSIVVDLGGQWIGPGQHRVLALQRELGLASHETFTPGRTLFEFQQRLGSYDGPLPWSYPLAFLGVARGIAKLERLAKKLPLDERQWLATETASLDAQSVATWIDREVWPERARILLRFALEAMFCCDLREVSLLLALFGISRCGSLEHMLAVKGGAQERQFTAGTEQLVQCLAAPVREHVRFGSAVERIEQSGTCVRISGAGFDVRAKHAVVAIPAPLLKRIEFVPALDPRRTAVIDAMRMGSVVKFALVYERTFWRERGFSGQVWQASGPLGGSYDTTPEDCDYGLLSALSAAGAADHLSALPPVARRAAVLTALAQHLGPDALTPRHYAERLWNDELWTGGGYGPHMPAGSFAGFAPLRAPHGLVHWAGTETAQEWPGYMEGALESAERVVRELLART
jgi:monoamine oxidase